MKNARNAMATAKSPIVFFFSLPIIISPNVRVIPRTRSILRVIFSVEDRTLDEKLSY